MSDLMLPDQLLELQELERARVKHGLSGFQKVIQEILDRYKDEARGILFKDPKAMRCMQAKCLWDKGFGLALGMRSFDDYLKTIPEIPESLHKHDSLFEYLSLADPRLNLVMACALIRIELTKRAYLKGVATPFDERHTDIATPFWFRHNGGWNNRNRRPDHCRDECIGDILAGTATTGVFAYFHSQQILKKGMFELVLPGSVRRTGKYTYSVSLSASSGRPKLFAYKGLKTANQYSGTLCVRMR